MHEQTRTQIRHTQLSSAAASLLIVAALALGALGGYALRGVGAEIRGAQAASTSADITHPALVPRAAREEMEVAPMPPALVPRSVREGTEITPWQAPAPRWTHEDDQPSGK